MTLNTSKTALLEKVKNWAYICQFNSKFQMPSSIQVIPVYLWKASILKFLQLPHRSSLEVLLTFVCACFACLHACVCCGCWIDREYTKLNARSVRDDRHTGRDAIRRSLLPATVLAFLTGSLCCVQYLPSARTVHSMQAASVLFIESHFSFVSFVLVFVVFASVIWKKADWIFFRVFTFAHFSGVRFELTLVPSRHEPHAAALFASFAPSRSRRFMFPSFLFDARCQFVPRLVTVSEVVWA